MAAGWKLEGNRDIGVLQDHHGLVGDTSVRVDLLENLVDIGGVGLSALLLALLLVIRASCCLLGGLASLASGGLCNHNNKVSVYVEGQEDSENCTHWLPFHR